MDIINLSPYPLVGHASAPNGTFHPKGWGASTYPPYRLSQARSSKGFFSGLG